MRLSAIKEVNPPSILALVLLTAFSSSAHAEIEVRGNFTGELTYFAGDSIHQGDQTNNVSIAAELEFYSPLGENGSITVTPFARVDAHDEERSHVDFREFQYTHVSDTWEAKVGLGKVFFGVAESINLVDIINQFDGVESLSTDEKLGQPMFNLLLIRDWGDIDLYVLPGFRERTFPGVNGRPRLPIPINTNASRFESSDGRSHIDVAARVSTIAGDWDLGAHIFHGTAREPELQFDPAFNQLVPFYAQITQLGMDAQATLESWLLKTELIYRLGDSFDDHAAGVAGFEYSFFDIRGAGADLGIVAEYIFDDRGKEGPAVFQNDVLLGFRFALNDADSTDALLGFITDLDGDGTVISLEASRRFGSSLKGSLTYTGWSVKDSDSTLNLFDQEDNVLLELGYFF